MHSRTPLFLAVKFLQGIMLNLLLAVVACSQSKGNSQPQSHQSTATSDQDLAAARSYLFPATLAIQLLYACSTDICTLCVCVCVCVRVCMLQPSSSLHSRFSLLCLNSLLERASPLIQRVCNSLYITAPLTHGFLPCVCSCPPLLSQNGWTAKLCKTGPWALACHMACMTNRSLHHTPKRGLNFQQAVKSCTRSRQVAHRHFLCMLCIVCVLCMFSACVHVCVPVYSMGV